MTQNPFAAQVTGRPGLATITLSGDINAFAEEALNQAYAQTDAYQPTAVVLDFAGVNYINSTGIALIVGLLARTRQGRRTLAVCGLSDHYLEIFQITRLADFMTIYPDEATAVQAVLRAPL